MGADGEFILCSYYWMFSAPFKAKMLQIYNAIEQS